MNLLVNISIFKDHSLENDWVLFVDHKDFTDIIDSLSIVANNRAIRVMIAFTFGPTIDKPNYRPIR